MRVGRLPKKTWADLGYEVIEVNLVPYEGAWLSFERWKDLTTGQNFTRTSDLTESWIDNMAIFVRMEEHL